MQRQLGIGSISITEIFLFTFPKREYKAEIVCRGGYLLGKKDKLVKFITGPITYVGIAASVFSVALTLFIEDASEIRTAVGPLGPIVLTLVLLFCFAVFWYVIPPREKGQRNEAIMSQIHGIAHEVRDVIQTGNTDAKFIDDQINELSKRLASLFTTMVGKQCICSVREYYSDSNMVKYISYTGAYGDVQGTYVSKEDLYSAKEYKSLVTLLAVDDTNDGSYYEEHNMHDSHREDIYLHPILTRHDADEPSYVAPAFWNEKKKKYKNWTLPGADSCIVVPIRCALNVEREPNGGKLPDEKVLSVNKPNEKIPRPAYSWLGFLAIDCADFDVFHNYHDKWLLATVADLLYVLLKLKNSK